MVGNGYGKRIAMHLLSAEFFTRTSHTLLFPLYALALMIIVFQMFRDVILNWCAVIVSKEPVDAG